MCGFTAPACWLLILLVFTVIYNPIHKKVYFIYLYVFASREDLQLRAESAGSLVKRRASFPTRY